MSESFHDQALCISRESANFELAPMSVWPANVRAEFPAPRVAKGSQSDSWIIRQSWESLLRHLFSFERFTLETDSYYVPTTLDSAGSWDRVRVEQYDRFTGTRSRKPVLVVQLESESKLPSLYWRGQLDYEVRAGIEQMRTKCSHPVIHGIAVFGRRMAFYTKNGDESIVPPRPPFDAKLDLAPEARWELDVMTEEGAEHLKEIVKQIIAECDRELAGSA
ncbi:hypothetical protein DFH08DRAFT_932383 [Mycena albidolilacea]|uniref:Uncharacterized protein n=1 Tax=Mycena albidolilacea TaxID=1033008 RepID=A0AAD7F0J9_9AGAR|nr:hypothetical protein DFH08DRAFT_932383 [Mycena albidolilacea]